jgi:hypothetical protein
MEIEITRMAKGEGEFTHVTNYEGLDLNSPTLEGPLRGAGSCMEHFGIFDNDDVLYDTALSITSGDIVVIRMQPNEINEGRILTCKKLEQGVGRWWYGSGDGLQSKDKRHEILGRVVMVAHRPRDLPLRDPDLFKKLQAPADWFIRTLMLAAPILTEWKQNGGPDRTTVYRQARRSANGGAIN